MPLMRFILKMRRNLVGGWTRSLLRTSCNHGPGDALKMKTKNNLLSSASHFALVAGVTVSLSAFAVSASAQPVTAEPESDAAAIVTAPLDVQGQAEGYATDHLSSAKQTAPLLDTPQTVTVVPQQIIKEQG